MSDEASRLEIDITNDKLYIALKAYMNGLKAAEGIYSRRS